jgi:hypothetical protein
MDDHHRNSFGDSSATNGNYNYLNRPIFLSRSDLPKSVIYLKTVHPTGPVTAKCLQLTIPDPSELYVTDCSYNSGGFKFLSALDHHHMITSEVMNIMSKMIHILTSTPAFQRQRTKRAQKILLVSGNLVLNVRRTSH